MVPFSSQIDRIYPGEALVAIGETRSKAMADQIMATDKSRLKSRLGVLSASDMEAVDDAVRLHLALKD
ncbi:MAG: type II toxin-antitoxin system PemK/MazF family toxin [Fulvimarina manganoxydans]|nr:type II toxin-antitoxin system PemK/MazF family toxin [Fulvimarina manganoxydans]